MARNLGVKVKIPWNTIDKQLQYKIREAYPSDFYGPEEFWEMTTEAKQEEVLFFILNNSKKLTKLTLKYIEEMNLS